MLELLTRSPLEREEVVLERPMLKAPMVMIPYFQQLLLPRVVAVVEEIQESLLAKMVALVAVAAHFLLALVFLAALGLQTKVLLVVLEGQQA
jgi:hypothetical protein